MGLFLEFKAKLQVGLHDVARDLLPWGWLPLHMVALQMGAGCWVDVGFLVLVPPTALYQWIKMSRWAT